MHEMHRWGIEEAANDVFFAGNDVGMMAQGCWDYNKNGEWHDGRRMLGGRRHTVVVTR
jgi:hypothetical protein